MNTEIKQKLEQLAYKRTTPFCYGCYQTAPTGVCSGCMSDDLMRELEGVGVEYGVSWVIEHILASELTPANLEEAFEESVRQCYPEEVQVGWIILDPVSVMKSHDPISWRCALSEYESEEESEGNIISIDGGLIYYCTNDVENLLTKENKI